MANTSISLLLSQGLLTKLWDNTNKKIISPNTSLPINNGQLYIGYDNTEKRAMLFTDIGGNRYSFAADVTWNDIKNKPQLINNETFSAFQTTISNTYLPFSGGELTGTLYTAQSSPIIINKAGKIGIRAGVNNVTFPTGHQKPMHAGQINISDSWYTNEKRDDQGNSYKYWGSQISSYNGETGLYNHLRVSHHGLEFQDSTQYTTNDDGSKEEKVYQILDAFSNITIDQSNNNKLTFNSLNNNKIVEWTAKNYYPTSVLWDTNTVNGVAGTISMSENGTSNEDLTINIPALPEASEISCGILNIEKQNIGGEKNFTDPIKLDNKITLSYNSQTESLDFTFI